MKLQKLWNRNCFDDSAIFPHSFLRRVHEMVQCHSFGGAGLTSL
jgi:hypothetical protein